MVRNSSMKNKIITLVFLLSFFYASSIIFNLEWQNPDNIENRSKNKQKDKELENIRPKGSSSTPKWIGSVGAQPSVAISADGKYIACGCTQGDYWGTNYLFSKSSSTPLWTHNNNSRSVAISADGKYILTAGVLDRNIYLYNNTSSLPIWHTMMGAGPVSSVAISADGNYFAIGSSVGYVQVYNITDDKSNPILIMSEGNVWVRDIAISSNGNFVAVGRNDGVYFYNISKPSPKLAWDYSTSQVWSVAISSDGDYIAAVTGGNRVYLFNKSDSSPLWWDYVDQWPGSVDISSDGQYIVAGIGNDVAGYDEVILYNASSSNPLWSYSASSPIYSVSISGDGKYIAAGTGYGAPGRGVYFFLRSSSVPLWYYPTGGNDHDVAISSDGGYLVASGPGSLYLFNIKPEPFNLTSNADAPNTNGNFKLNWSLSNDADSYSVYTHDKFITEINDTVTLLDSGIINSDYSISGLIDGRYYYMVVAHNDEGNRSSNCISVDVKLIPQINFEISDFYLNTTRPLETDLGLEINCSITNSSTIKWVYLCENSTGSFVNRSMTQSINNLWSYNLSISALSEGDQLMFSFYVNNSFGNIGYLDNGGSNFTILIDDFYIDPILINGIDDFSSQNGVRNPWAAGTKMDPFIIENWIIDGGSLGTCIDILNSDVYFIIRNCTVFNSQVGPIGTDPFFHAGIRLFNVSNARIINNNCSNNRFTGIRLYYNCNYNTIEGNIANKNPDIGIFLRNGSHNNIIYNNICNNNSQWGISLYENCDYNIINSNTVNSSEKDGIYILNGCDNNIIFNNTISSNQWDGILIKNTSTNNKIFQNKISNNQDTGINIESSCNGNIVYYNQITDNYIQANDDGSYNNWDNEGIGNIWSDYITRYPSAGNDGFVWNISYGIDGSASSQDNYPLCGLNPMIGFKISSDYLNTTAPLETAVGLEITCSILSWYNLEWVYLCENSNGTFVNRSMSLRANGKWIYIVNISDLNAGDVLMFSFYAKYNPIIHFDNAGLNYSIRIGAGVIAGRIAGNGDNDDDNDDMGDVDLSLMVLIILGIIICGFAIFLMVELNFFQRIISFSANHSIKSRAREKANLFENLVKKSKVLINKSKKQISKESYAAAVENWKESINYYNLAQEKAPTPDENNLKILRENICNIYLKFMSINCLLTKGTSLIFQDNKIITKSALGLNVFLSYWLENDKRI